ncbi:uncharacterized protein LOC128711142 [Anopheles marshallii]|uniref:uncharacterized protein LOC128711142 n=1 Tax=Anopheles marshallii TaxID=1521116 RepID=UPI00237A5B8D|nr:uncharacterized protein LOC128711142 [Anopheles marshallii]
MKTIGKSPRSVNRVKSEYTITGPKMNRGTPPALSTPINTRIPGSKSSISPQTVFYKKTIPRKLMIGDVTPHLTRSSPSSKAVRKIMYVNTSDKLNTCMCDPELLGKDTSHPNCTFVNICNEHRRGVFRCREYFSWLWQMVGWMAQVLLASIVVFVVCNAALNGVYWMFGGKFKKSSNEEMHAAEESMLYDEKEDEAEQLNHNLMEFNPKGYSLTETTHTFNILDLFIMTLELMNGFFGWIGTILLPGEE